MTSRQRIAQIAPVAMPVRPDTGRSIEQIVHLLSEELVRRGHEVTLFATGDSDTSARLESVYAHGYGEDPSLWDWRFHESMHVAAAFERADEFDVIHSHSYHFALPFTRLVSTPVLHTHHVSILPDVAAAYRRYPEARLVAVSAFQDGELGGLSEAVIRHGVDVESFSFHTGRGEYLLFLGQMEWNKGPLAAIEAARAVDLPLVLAGPLSDYYREAVAPLVDGVGVRFVGPVGPSERNELLSRAAALVYPIQAPEPFGLVMIEAMACGTPVAAIDLGAVSEVVDQGVTGHLASRTASLPEAIRACLTLERQDIRLVARQRFSHLRMVDEHEQLYRRILARAPAGAM